MLSRSQHQLVVHHAGEVRVWTRHGGAWRPAKAGVQAAAEVTWVEVAPFVPLAAVGLGELRELEAWWRTRALGAARRAAIIEAIAARGARLRRLHLLQPTEWSAMDPARPPRLRDQADLRPTALLQGERRQRQDHRRRWAGLLAVLALGFAGTVFLPNLTTIIQAQGSGRAADSLARQTHQARRAQEARQRQAEDLRRSREAASARRTAALDWLRQPAWQGTPDLLVWLDACMLEAEPVPTWKVRGWTLAPRPGAATALAQSLGANAVTNPGPGAVEVPAAAGAPQPFAWQWTSPRGPLETVPGGAAWASRVHRLFAAWLKPPQEPGGLWSGEIDSLQLASLWLSLEGACDWITLRRARLERVRPSHEPHQDRLLDAPWRVSLELMPAADTPPRDAAAPDAVNRRAQPWVVPRRVRQGTAWVDPLDLPPPGQLTGFESRLFRLQWGGFIEGPQGPETLLHDSEAGTWKRLVLRPGQTVSDCTVVSWDLRPSAPQLQVRDLRSQQTLALGRAPVQDPAPRVHLRADDGSEQTLGLGERWACGGITWVLRAVDLANSRIRLQPEGQPGREQFLHLHDHPRP